MSDASGSALVFENFVRQKGFQSYGDREVGAPAEAAAEWFEMWAEARAALCLAIAKAVPLTGAAGGQGQ